MNRAFGCGLLASAIILSGCAHTGPRGASLHDCALAAASAGVVAGAATGAIYAENNDDSGEGAAVGAGVAVGTALVGLGACWLFAPERAHAAEEEPASCDPCGQSQGPRLARAPEPVALPLVEPPAPPPNPCEVPTILEGVHFGSDRHELRPDAVIVLRQAVEPLLACPVRRIRVEAHTDSHGSADYNEALSVRRALTVMRFLEDHGVASSRLESKGWGEARPAASNDTREGRAWNRRVELHPIE
jgi:OOP family OmpA-OmpF porin